jgi:translation initiation factor 2B subunit (eIF-2B alpha/beta/delta family)
VDRLLRRQIDAVARDRRSGAAELALRAVGAMQDWLRRHRTPTGQELEEIAGALLRAQPSMAPLLRLANQVALAADTADSRKTLAQALREFAGILRTGRQQIAQRFLRTLPWRGRKSVKTYSYSSTVLSALVCARSRIGSVWCSEGRPGNEGRRTAARLARAGIRVCLLTDAALLEGFLSMPVVVGADMIVPGAFLNKVGSNVLVAGAQPRVRRKFHTIVLADTLKFWPEPVHRRPSLLWKQRNGPPGEVWRGAPAGVSIQNQYFVFTALAPQVRILTERGPMTPAQVRRELKRIRIAPRLKKIAAQMAAKR